MASWFGQRGKMGPRLLLVAALEVELYLLDGRTRAVLHSVRFAKVAPAERRNPRDVATTLASLLGDAVRELLSGAGTKIARHP